MIYVTEHFTVNYPKTLDNYTNISRYLLHKILCFVKKHRKSQTIKAYLQEKTCSIIRFDIKLLFLIVNLFSSVPLLIQ